MTATRHDSCKRRHPGRGHPRSPIRAWATPAQSSRGWPNPVRAGWARHAQRVEHRADVRPRVRPTHRQDAASSTVSSSRCPTPFGGAARWPRRVAMVPWASRVVMGTPSWVAAASLPSMRETERLSLGTGTSSAGLLPVSSGPVPRAPTVAQSARTTSAPCAGTRDLLRLVATGARAPRWRHRRQAGRGEGDDSAADGQARAHARLPDIDEDEVCRNSTNHGSEQRVYR